MNQSISLWWPRDPWSPIISWPHLLLSTWLTVHSHWPLANYEYAGSCAGSLFRTLARAVPSAWKFLPDISMTVEGGNHEDMTAGWPSNWTRAIRGSSPTPLSLECEFCPLFPQWELFQGHNFERARCCWDHLDWRHDWTLLRPLYKLFKILVGECGGLLVLLLPKTKPRM